jgi:hypothetical protein
MIYDKNKDKPKRLRTQIQEYLNLLTFGINQELNITIAAFHN